MLAKTSLDRFLLLVKLVDNKLHLKVEKFLRIVVQRFYRIWFKRHSIVAGEDKITTETALNELILQFVEVK